MFTHSLSYIGEDAQRYFLQPMFVGNPVTDIFHVIQDVKGSIKLDKFSKLEKITKAYSKGFSGDGGSVYDQKTLTVVRAKAEASQGGNAFWSSVKGEALRRGYQKDDIDGTVLKEIVADTFRSAVIRDLNRQLFFGDVTLGDPGGDATAQALAENYRLYDGIFKVLEGLPSGQKLTIDAGALGIDAALSTFEAMYDAAPPELLELEEDAVIMVSRSMAQNYRESLQNIGWGTETANTALINGVPTLTWNGIPVIERREWDTHIAIDSLATDPHRAIFTVKNNIVIGTDYNEGEAEEWYNQDEEENRMRVKYVVGVQYLNDELTVTALAD